jgi:hypothetical protein
MEKKIDLRKELKQIYTPSAKEPELIQVPKFNFLMIDGEGAPESPQFHEAIQAIYSTAYTMKFTFKFEKKINFPVMALEGLWWVKQGTPFQIGKRDDWCWTLMILQPRVVTKTTLTRAIRKIKQKKEIPALEKIRLEPFTEGLSVQMLHIGPYADEPVTMQRIEDFSLERGLTASGKHHEIYMSDPRRVKPEKMKTILRHAVKKILLNEREVPDIAGRDKE